MSDELKPCPFCGGMADEYHDLDKDLMFVSCTECFISTPKVSAVTMVLKENNNPTQDKDAALQEVVRRWNHRTNDKNDRGL